MQKEEMVHEVLDETIGVDDDKPLHIDPKVPLAMGGEFDCTYMVL